MTISLRCLSIAALSATSILCVGNASATLTNTVIQVNATAAELTEAGFTQFGTGPFISYPSGECAVNGCVTLAGQSGTFSPKGFLEFQFQDYTYNPAYYSGLFSILSLEFGNSGYTMGSLISLINTETATTGVTALTTAQANNAQGTCSFSEWLPANLQDALVLNWYPSTPPGGSGLSQVYRLAWDFTNLPAPFQGGGIGVTGGYGVPAPGAITLLCAVGFFSRRRR